MVACRGIQPGQFEGQRGVVGIAAQQRVAGRHQSLGVDGVVQVTRRAGAFRLGIDDGGRDPAHQQHRHVLKGRRPFQLPAELVSVQVVGGQAVDDQVGRILFGVGNPLQAAAGEAQLVVAVPA